MGFGLLSVFGVLGSLLNYRSCSFVKKKRFVLKSSRGFGFILNLYKLNPYIKNKVGVVFYYRKLFFFIRHFMFWLSESVSLYYKIYNFKRQIFMYLNCITSRYLMRKNFIFLKSVSWQDPEILLNFLVFFLNGVHFSMHRILIKKNILTYLSVIRKYSLLSGLNFFVSGKLSVGGNSRTRTMAVRWGCWANSKS